ncbi:MAG: zinc metallopeptidase [Chthoniobacterales bacterium]|nr:zinc metallopeptidase [Chthoniobacterales bacterium]
MNMSAYLFLIGIPLILGLWAQFRVSSTLKRYEKITISSRLTGAEAAQQILSASGIHDVKIMETDSMMGDHYNPTDKTLHLSSAIFSGNSIAAVGVAAHECGHALQDKESYAPLKLRLGLVPATQFSSQILPFVILGGFLFHMAHLITLGIACYAVLMLFQLITLPVEFDASSRAKVILKKMGIVQSPLEITGVHDVLNAAAWTYVAAFVAVLGNLIYLLLVRRSER